MSLRPIHAQVVLNPPLGSIGHLETAERTSGCCKASPELWEVLLKRRKRRRRRSDSDDRPDGRLCIAIKLEKERRLEGGSQGLESIIVWVEREDVHGEDSKGRRILVNPSLFPPHTPIPDSFLLDIHEPISLSLAILQPIINHPGDDAPSLDIDNLDLSPFVSSPPVRNGLPNGSTHSLIHGAPIIRQSQDLNLSTFGGETQRFRVLMLEPVLQGLITPLTQIIISKTPHTQVPPNNDQTTLNGYTRSESSHSRTRLSTIDFDPDAFLSSSLDFHPLSLSNGDTLDGQEGEGRWNSLEGGSSVTSGSVTPRQGRSSPVAVVGDVVPDIEGDGWGSTGKRFGAVRALGKGGGEGGREGEDVCWLGVGSLGRSGIFDGDWVLLSAVSSGSITSERLVRAVAWEYLDEEDCKLPENIIILPPALHRPLFPDPITRTYEITLSPTPSGVRKPALPIARSVTIARVATAEGVDKRYERSWLKGISRAFSGEREGKGKGKERAVQEEEGRAGILLRRGDIISVPIWIDRLVAPEGEDEQSDTSDSDDDDNPYTSDKRIATNIAYFKVTALNFEPLIPLEEDFRSSISSKARAGEYGCWVQAGEEGSTRLVLEGMERGRIQSRAADRSWHGVGAVHRPFHRQAEVRFRDLLGSCFAKPAMAYMIQLSVLIKGSRGAGKTSLVRYIADELGFNVVNLDCYDIVGDTHALTQGSILAAADKARSCSPSILLLGHIEALAKKSESTALGKQSGVVKVLEDLLVQLKEASRETGWPCVLVGTTGDVDAVPGDVLGVFKQEVGIPSPNDVERMIILENCIDRVPLAPDVTVKGLSSQTAALSPLDISSFLLRATDLALQRAMTSANRPTALQAKQAGLSITAVDVRDALGEARASYADSIGAPKIPDVKWEDVGGLQSVKREILDTVQLPLDRPELFAEGLKKRSGILLYGPPGTGKTLLAKAVATSCSLNFLSVKGPELLNMYIGESEANVRRIFQRARDASPCLIFMDELDSVAPKRGNQGDSGGVMDRIVSQLLAELDGMSGGDDSMVLVMGATNRPDLLDPALLRPGRFDRMLYLSVATTHEAQYDILKALTRKFNLDGGLDLREVAEMCPFNYTGADFYALCSDAMLGAMTGKAEAVEERIKELDNVEEGERKWPHPLTPQFYLGSMATKEEIEVKVGREDFIKALGKLVPSVSRGEMEHYERVQAEFKGFEIGKVENGIQHRV